MIINDYYLFLNINYKSRIRGKMTEKKSSNYVL